MPLRKQEFYEGAALHQLARSGKIKSLKYEAPFFFINNSLLVCLKYSTGKRSPWGFTFSQDELVLFRNRSRHMSLFIGLICGADGVAAIPYRGFRDIIGRRKASIHVACYRGHGEHYAVFGPNGEHHRKIAPSVWQHILDESELL